MGEVWDDAIDGSKDIAEQLGFSGNENAEEDAAAITGNAENATALQAMISAELFNQSNPLRRALLGSSQRFAADRDITDTAGFAALKTGADAQFGRAKDNIMGRVAKGGALTDALTQLETNRAVAMTQGAGALEENEMARAVQLATGGTGISVSGLGQAGNTQALLSQSAADRSAAKSGATGQAAGAYLGGK